MYTKNIFIFSVIFIGSCSKQHKTEEIAVIDRSPAPYDTTAIDSFSKGAISAEIARNIRMSSKAYQDSLLQEKLRQEEIKKQEEEAAKIEKATKEALEKEQAKERQKAKQEEVNSVSATETTTL